MTEEKFELFEIYQKNIHHEDDKDPDGFDRFLVESPLLVRDFIYYHDGIFNQLFCGLSMRIYLTPEKSRVTYQSNTAHTTNSTDWMEN